MELVKLKKLNKDFNPEKSQTIYKKRGRFYTEIPEGYHLKYYKYDEGTSIYYGIISRNKGYLICVLTMLSIALTSIYFVGKHFSNVVSVEINVPEVIYYKDKYVKLNLKENVPEGYNGSVYLEENGTPLTYKVEFIDREVHEVAFLDDVKLKGTVVCDLVYLVGDLKNATTKRISVVLVEEDF